MENIKNIRALGQTGIMVSPIGLGCWQFSKQKNLAGKFWPILEDKLIERIVSLSIVGGINWFDTAEIYGGGESEKALSKALKAAGEEPGDVIVATKWWPMFRFASNITKTINKRISLLDPYPVDLYQVHQPWSFSGENREMEKMAELVSMKLIKAVGVSNFSAQKMENSWKVLQKFGIPLATNQVRYNLLDRKIESNGVMDRAKKLGISIIAYSPLAQGIVTGKYHDNPHLSKNAGIRRYSPQFKAAGLEKSRPVVALLKELAIKYNVTAAQVALNWIIQYNGDMVVAIPGATKETHVKENLGALTFMISDEDMISLDKVSSIFK